MKTHPVFHTLETLQGVPVYLDELPELFTPVSLELCVMSGSADDMAVGQAGIHHWGEHLPFRGTAAFPNGNIDISARIARMGGSLNAYTSHHNTVYYVSVPKSRWKDGLEVLVELAGRPLNRPEDVEAERKIIEQEMKQGRSEQMDVFWEEKHARLWGTHPLAQSIIGTETSLATMDVSTINKLHEYRTLVITNMFRPDEPNIRTFKTSKLHTNRSTIDISKTAIHKTIMTPTPSANEM
jgi:predicted Zn-dependent peptidase